MKRPRSETPSIHTLVIRPARTYRLVWGPGPANRTRAYWLDDTTGRPAARPDTRDQMESRP